MRVGFFEKTTKLTQTSMEIWNQLLCVRQKKKTKTKQIYIKKQYRNPCYTCKTGKQKQSFFFVLFCINYWDTTQQWKAKLSFLKLLTDTGSYFRISLNIVTNYYLNMGWLFLVLGWVELFFSSESCGLFYIKSSKVKIFKIHERSP